MLRDSEKLSTVGVMEGGHALYRTQPPELMNLLLPEGLTQSQPPETQWSAGQNSVTL